VDAFGLSENAQRRVAVILAAVFDESEEITRDVASFLDVYLRRVPLLPALGLRVAVWAIVWLPILFVGRPLPADALPPDVRRAYLAKWSDAHLYFVREAFYLVKAIALLGWGAHAKVRARFGMPEVHATWGGA
jgi:hypothetical protein